MTQITIKNRIMIDEQVEKIHQTFSGDYYQKNGNHFLVYQNEIAEKVVMKYDHEMLTITRFSTPSTIIKLHPEVKTKALITTPVGQQAFEVITKKHQSIAEGFNTEYEFWQGNTKIAQYDLSVCFSD